MRETESSAEFVVAEGWAEAEGGESGCALARGVSCYLFSFGTFFVAGRPFTRARGSQRSFGCEDYALAAGGSRVLNCWSFGAQAEEHVAAAEVGLGRVVERVLLEDLALRLCA